MPEALPALRAGRELCWAPDWPCSDGRIVFDRVSGDYWILSPEAAALVRQAETQTGSLRQGSPDLIQELQQTGLLAGDAGA